MTKLDNETRYNKLMALHAAESETLVRDLMIELLEPETSKSKSGRSLTFMTWKYFNPLNDKAGWKTRKSPMYTKETKLLLAHGPYEPEALYRVTAKKNARQYWEWEKIEKLEQINQAVEVANDTEVNP